MSKAFPIFRESGHLNYWDCISQRLKKFDHGRLRSKFWATKVCDATWEQHKAVIKRVKYGVEK